MHIPDKYRERYDALAETYTWMREMRDEPTNVIGGEANGIHAESPLDVEPPEGDAIEHARWRWKYRPGEKSEVVMSEYNCNLLMSDLDAIADMVERDYVSRKKWTEAIRAMKAAQDAMEQARDERDDMKSELDRYEHDCNLLFTERDDYKDIVDVLKHERDNLKAKIAEYEDKSKQITMISDGRIYTGSKALVEKIAEQDRRIAELLAEIEKLRNERDEAVEAYDKHMEAHDAWHEAEDIKYTRNRFSVLEKAKNERIAKLESERDEWKSECSKLTDKIGEITDEGSELMKKQPYTFDVHDVPGSLQTVGRYIDELTAERDEWKRKAENLGSNLGSGSEVGSEVDSREKLEDDVGFIVKEGFVTYKGIIGWLDRQAAITKSQMHERYYHAACVKDERTRTLRAEYEDCISELEHERDYWREQMRKCLDATRCGEDAAESLMAYPLPAGRVQPYLMVIDAIDRGRDEACDLWTALSRLESRLDAIEDGMDGGLA